MYTMMEVSLADVVDAIQVLVSPLTSGGEWCSKCLPFLANIVQMLHIFNTHPKVKISKHSLYVDSEFYWVFSPLCQPLSLLLLIF